MVILKNFLRKFTETEWKMKQFWVNSRKVLQKFCRNTKRKSMDLRYCFINKRRQVKFYCPHAMFSNFFMINYVQRRNFLSNMICIVLLRPYTPGPVILIKSWFYKIFTWENPPVILIKSWFCKIHRCIY